MKPFLGKDITHDKKNEEYNGKEFIVAEPSPAMAVALESSAEKALGVMEASKLPLPLRIVKSICGVAAALIAVAIIRALGRDDIGIAEAYGNAPALFWVLGVTAVLWLILKLLADRKEKAVLGSEDSARIDSRLDGVVESIFAEFGVPDSACDVDILSFKYKLKDGIPKVVESGMTLAPYDNFVYKLFSDAENIYLANADVKYAFPLDSLRTIRKVNKKAIVPSWNKDEAMNEGEYKQYKVAADKFGSIHIKPYYILEFEREGELWGIYFPCYELPAFTELTGLSVEE